MFSHFFALSIQVKKKKRTVPYTKYTCKCLDREYVSKIHINNPPICICTQTQTHTTFDCGVLMAVMWIAVSVVLIYQWLKWLKWLISMYERKLTSLMCLWLWDLWELNKRKLKLQNLFKDGNTHTGSLFLCTTIDVPLG